VFKVITCEGMIPSRVIWDKSQSVLGGQCIQGYSVLGD
jgi:hypothetical protein